MSNHAAIEVNVSSARDNLPDYIKLASEGEYVYVTDKGERVAALVAAHVAECWEAEEDARWARRVAEAEKSGTVPWDATAAGLGRLAAEGRTRTGSVTDGLIAERRAEAKAEQAEIEGTA